MKKTVSLILSAVLLLSLCLAGCGNAGGKDAKKGETHKINLAANYNTGCAWKFEESKKGIVKITSDFVPNKDDELSGTEVFSVTAVKPGKVTVTFLYTDAGGNALSDAVYEFTVDASLKFLSVKSSGTYYENMG